MIMTGVSLIGWLHTFAATLAILAGAIVFLGPKGTARHRLMGRAYVIAMLVMNVSAFGVYRFDIRFAPFKAGPGVFGLFHYEALFTLFFLGLGFYAATRQRRALWAYLHPVSMLVTYYMLIGGLVNELFVRVPVLSRLALQGHTGNPAATPLVGMTQFAVMAAFLALLVWYVTKVALGRRRRTAIAL